jgi:hypothetical protein
LRFAVVVGSEDSCYSKLYMRPPSFGFGDIESDMSLEAPRAPGTVKGTFVAALGTLGVPLDTLVVDLSRLNILLFIGLMHNLRLIKTKDLR